MERRLRYTSRTIANPTPTSAAATAITYRANTCPSTLPCRRAKAMKLRLTALRISSTDINTITALRRASTPYTPMQNSTAPSSKKLATNTRLVLQSRRGKRQRRGAAEGASCERPRPSARKRQRRGAAEGASCERPRPSARARLILAGQDDGADRGGEQDERDGEERHEVRRQHVVGDRLGRGRAAILERGVPEGVA